MLNQRDVKKLYELKEDLRRSYDEDTVQRISSLYVGVLLRKRRNRKITILGLTVSTMIAFLMMFSGLTPLGGIIAEWHDIFCVLGILTAVTAVIYPMYDDKFGFYSFRFKNEIQNLK